jgi:hypothetical protein
MSTTNQYNDWAAKIIEWTESEEGEKGNQNLTAFCNATNPESLERDDRLKAITSTPGIIALAATEEKKIVVLHSIKNLGGSLIRRQDKVLALQGVSHDAPAVELIVESALKNYKSKAPKFDDLKEKTVDELKEVPVLTRITRDCIHLSGIVIPPPYLASIIAKAAKEVENGELDPMELVVKILAAAKAFDEDHDEEDEYIEGGDEKSEQLVRWLLSVFHSFVEPTNLKSDAEDDEAKTYRVQQHEKWILPPLDDPRRVQRIEGELAMLRSQNIQVNATLSRIGEVLETNNQLQSKKIELTEERMDREKDRTDKYHDSVIRLLRGLASYDGETAASEPADSILAILNCDTHAKAEKELVHQFREKGVEPSFAVGTSKALHEGKFTWPSDNEPVNFSPFTVTEASANDTSMNTRDIFISTTELNGEKMSEKQIEKWLKQAIKTPSSYHELEEQLAVFQAKIEIAGGDTCFTAYKVKCFIKTLKTLKKKVESQIALNKDTAPYILYQVGLRVNNYLVALERNEELDDVPRSIISFASIEDKIRNLELVPVLPSCFKSSKREKEDADENEEAGNNNSNKRRKTNKHGGAKMIRNEDRIGELTLKDGEKWKGVFTGKEARKDLPKWGKCKMCPKWHVNGHCFDDCVDAESHVPKKDVSAEKKAEMVAWKEVRQAV